jgi:hypothetical protein
MLLEKRNGKREGAAFIHMGAKEVTILLRASQDLACLSACDTLTGMFGCGLSPRHRLRKSRLTLRLMLETTLEQHHTT